MFKHEEETLKMQEKKVYLKRLEKMNDYEIHKKLDVIKEKERKMDELKKEKYQILLKKKEMADEVARQKKEVKERFDIVMKKHRGINENALKELFPDDSALVERLLQMKSSIASFNSSKKENDLTETQKNETSNKPNSSKQTKDPTEIARTGGSNSGKGVNDNSKKLKEMKAELSKFQAKLDLDLQTVISQENQKVKAAQDSLAQEEDEEQKLKLEADFESLKEKSEGVIEQYKK